MDFLRRAVNLKILLMMLILHTSNTVQKCPLVTVQSNRYWKKKREKSFPVGFSVQFCSTTVNTNLSRLYSMNRALKCTHWGNSNNHGLSYVLFSSIPTLKLFSTFQFIKNKSEASLTHSLMGTSQEERTRHSQQTQSCEVGHFQLPV